MIIYTKYFSGFTKENDQHNVSSDQFKRIMNIVFVEGILQGTLLTDLSGNLDPKQLVREMFMLSGDKVTLQG